MIPRVFTADAASGRTLALAPDEARHLTQILRLDAGDLVRVFDGAGHEFEARLTAASRGSVVVRVGNAIPPAAEPRVAVTLAAAVLKPERMDDLVRDAAMMGIAALQPLVTARTSVSEAALRRRAVGERWRRIAIASVRQCGRAVVPHVLPPLTLAALLASARPHPSIMLVEPRPGSPAGTDVTTLSRPVPAAALLVSGPEGGWTADEVTQGRAAGLVPLTLGVRTLRADAVPIVALTLLFYVWGDL